MDQYETTLRQHSEWRICPVWWTGIKLYDKWRSFENFRDWALANGYEPGLTIDRKDNDAGYTPDNCRWVDRVIQANNRRTNRLVAFNNETHTAAEWARLLNVKYPTLLGKLNRGDMSDFESYFDEQT